jgi:hypothetical protein
VAVSFLSFLNFLILLSDPAEPVFNYSYTGTVMYMYKFSYYRALGFYTKIARMRGMPIHRTRAAHAQELPLVISPPPTSSYTFTSLFASIPSELLWNILLYNRHAIQLSLSFLFIDLVVMFFKMSNIFRVGEIFFLGIYPCVRSKQRPG